MGSVGRRRKRKVEQHVIATSADTKGEQVTVEESTTEVTSPGGKKSRKKKVAVERGESAVLRLALQHALCWYASDQRDCSSG